MIIAYTGHRPNKLGNEYDLKGPYSNHIGNQLRKILLEQRPDKCISGMALGFDQLAALITLELNIPLIAAIPCKNQEKIWPQKSQNLYYDILNNPLVEKVMVSEFQYTQSAMEVRNIWMVDHADKIIACFDGSFGGTRNCVRYAKLNKKEIIRIDPRNI
jgi:uncharacterized phage-like protein YoqJ